MKRFYKAAAAEPAAATPNTSADQGWHVTLDGRAVKTPGKRPLSLPTQALAQAIAQEWAAQGDQVVPDTMPLTQYACSALDRVAPARDQVIHQVSAFAETDLIAYPAQTPPELRARQDACWLPLINQLAAMDWPLRQTSGLIAIEQDASLRPRATAWLQAKSDMALTALASLIEASGSFFLPYLMAEQMTHRPADQMAGRGISLDQLIEACTLEEQFNLQTWGNDEEAEQLLARREADLRSAAQMLNLL